MPRRRRPPPPNPRAIREALYPTLDLHGDTGDEARRRAERWLRDQQAAGERSVRIITGRGLHSVGAPVLPGEIAGLLSDLKGTLVKRSEVEPGGGAFFVELRPPATPRPAATRKPEPAADPALHRRAAESLAELGVDPTPELIAAEMKRLGKM